MILLIQKGQPLVEVLKIDLTIYVESLLLFYGLSPKLDDMSRAFTCQSNKKELPTTILTVGNEK